MINTCPVCDGNTMLSRNNVYECNACDRSFHKCLLNNNLVELLGDYRHDFYYQSGQCQDCLRILNEQIKRRKEVEEAAFQKIVSSYEPRKNKK